MANIGFIQHRLSRTDGVSLEVDKWREVLERAGHTVHYFAGNEDVRGGQFLPELHPEHPITNRILKNATRQLVDYPDGAALLAAVRQHADILKPGIRRFVEANHLDLILPNNLLSVGYNLPGNLALAEVLAETGIPAIAHCHDFWWEESGEVYPTCAEVVSFYEEHTPPILPNLDFVVINRLAQRELLERRGAPSTVVPNVFDFEQAEWTRDDYNRDFREAIGLRPNDLYILQATRILDRKGIELAIDLVADLQRPENRARLESSRLYDGRKFTPGDRIVLVCAGYVESIGLSGSYHGSLVEKAAGLGVEVIWCGDLIQHRRGQTPDGRKIYSLWDSYVEADFVSYPSYWEGWGNQLIEAVFARKPVFLFEYPVYTSDLAEAGLDVVSMGNQLGPRDSSGLVTLPGESMEAATQGVLEMLLDPERRRQAVDHNFEVARVRYSCTALEGLLKVLFQKKGLPWN